MGVRVSHMNIKARCQEQSVSLVLECRYPSSSPPASSLYSAYVLREKKNKRTTNDTCV